MLTCKDSVLTTLHPASFQTCPDQPLPFHEAPIMPELGRPSTGFSSTLICLLTYILLASHPATLLNLEQYPFHTLLQPCAG